MRTNLAFCLLILSPTLAAFAEDGAKSAAAYPFSFRDVATEAGLLPAVSSINGHGAAWGDVDGDGWIDLYVGTFHYPETKPNLLLKNVQGKFQLDSQESVRLSQRATGVVFVDLDNDGDLDLYIGSMPLTKAKPPNPPLTGCACFRNDGRGQFTNITADCGACPAEFGGRSVAAVDFDGDGLLDLLVGEEPIKGYNGSKTRSSRLFRNLGKLQFEDASRAAGIPEDVPGLGVAAGDVNNDGWPDLFLAAPTGGNVLFVNDGKGKFQEAAGSRDVFKWEGAGGDNMVCGVCFSDVNRDALLDVVLGQHFQNPWQKPVPVRLYLNRGGATPTFEDVTEKCGIRPLPMKAPHVELQDFDNDGWPDLYTSLVKFRDGRPFPVIFRHQGVVNGLPQFKDEALGVNDFPNEQELAVKRTGDFFNKMIQDGRVIYMAPGPSGDFDNDGRLDLFLANWWKESPSLLLKNETRGGHWLQVVVEGEDGVNRQGIGSRIRVYPAGKLGDAKSLLGCRDVSVGFGYASGQPAISHFGLGEESKVDIEVLLPHGKGRLTRTAVAADQRIAIKK